MNNFTVLTLGSRDMIPMQKNDCSHYLVNGHILIDCGTSPVMNLLNCGADLSKIDTIIFTHLHCDHAIGLPSLLYYIYEVAKVDLSTVKIYGPQATIAEYVTKAMNFAGYTADKVNFPTVIGVENDTFTVNEPDGSVTVTTLKALHAVPTVCLKLTKNGVTLGFSGDTYPIPELNGFFRGANALVFEAAFGPLGADEDPAVVDEMKRKCGHASPADVARVANACGVQAVYLTHSRIDHAVQLADFRAHSHIPVKFLTQSDVFTA